MLLKFITSPRWIYKEFQWSISNQRAERTQENRNAKGFIYYSWISTVPVWTVCITHQATVMRKAVGNATQQMIWPSRSFSKNLHTFQNTRNTQTWQITWNAVTRYICCSNVRMRQLKVSVGPTIIVRIISTTHVKDDFKHTRLVTTFLGVQVLTHPIS